MYSSSIVVLLRVRLCTAGQDLEHAFGLNLVEKLLSTSNGFGLQLSKTIPQQNGFGMILV
jgi:divalent metal cation (Fe/Co/Zn/Cd) transporter